MSAQHNHQLKRTPGGATERPRQHHMMVDTQARSILAESARWLVSGRITNYEFDDRVPISRDPAVWEIYNQYLWLLYCDLREYRLVGMEKLHSRERERVLRCILFLKSGLPYKWPVLSRAMSALQTVFNLVTLGMAGRAYFRRLSAAGDMDYWPFLSEAEYIQALEAPSYLAGTVANSSIQLAPSAQLN